MKGPTAMTGAERAKRLRAARKAEGWKMVTIHLTPGAAARLDSLVARLEVSQGAVVELALSQLEQTLPE